MILRGAMRVYVEDAHTLRVAADDKDGGCVHLNLVDGLLVWVPMPEGAFVETIDSSDFTSWIDQGGLNGLR